MESKRMERLVSTKSRSFEWTRSGKISTLASGGHVYAKVTWVKAWGSLAIGESADGRWTLKRVGFLRPRVTVRSEGSQSDLAVVTMDFGGGGKVAFSDASAFTFRRTGFWRPVLVLEDSTGRKVFTVTPSSRLGKRGAVLELEEEAARSSWRTSLLAIVVWYIGVLVTEYDENASLAVIVASTATVNS